MGGSLTLWTALQHPEVAGIVCINPATKPQPAELMEMVHGMVDEGTDTMPGIGADIADPDATESAYEQTPLRPLISLVEDGLASLSERYSEITCPLLLLTSPQDHVVEPANGDFLAETFGGPVERDQPRAQLPRRHARLRQGRDLRGCGGVRPQGDSRRP